MEEIRNRRIPSFDEGSRVQYRDQNRVPGRRVAYLHSVVATGALVERHFPTTYDNLRLQHEDNFELGLTFVDDGTPAGGSSANEAVIRFSGAKSTTVTYNSGSGVYRLRQFNRDFIDANDNSHPEFTNVLVLQSRVSPLGDGGGRVDIVTTGKGDGYFLNGGRYVEIEWHRANKEAPFRYTLKEDGSELELGRGRTFIAIIPTTQDVEFS